MISKAQVLQALSQVNDPELHRSLVALKMIRDVVVKGHVVTVTIALTVPDCPLKDQIEADVRAAISALHEVEEVVVRMTAMTDEERTAVLGQPKDGMAAQFNRIRRVVAVMSGKGGVGKSLVTCLLAVALRHSGCQVGVLDADITGPSIPKLFGLRGPLQSGPVGLWPLSSQVGVKVMSINLILDEEDKPVVWRGPLVGKAITQLWGDVMWGTLDYLLIDLPPGTSDASLTTLQSLPVSGIVMVTTPQSLSSLIVRKAVRMAQLVGKPIVGIVENMAYFTCPDTGKQHLVFGPSHVEEIIRASGAPLLGQLPIEPKISTLCDAGKVEVVALDETPRLLKAFLNVVPRSAEGQT